MKIEEIPKTVMDKGNIMRGEKVIQTNGIYSQGKTEMEIIHNYAMSQMEIMALTTYYQRA
jgi:hypothetical protein